MARKKTSQTDSSDATKSADNLVTPSNEEPQDTPDTRPPEPSGDHSKTGADETGETPGKTPDRAMAEQEASDETAPHPTDAKEEVAAVAPDDAPAPPHETDTSPEQGTVSTQQETTPPDQETAADPARDAAPVVRTEQVTVRQGGFWSMLIGGIAAAGIGVVAAPYIHPYLASYLPTEQAPAAPDTAVMDRIDEQAQRLADLSARIDALPEPPDPSGEIAGLSETVTDLTGRIATLEGQVSKLEARPAPKAPDTAATDTALDAFRDRLAAQGTEIEQLRARLEGKEQAARDSARVTLQRAALTRVMTALDTGEPFSAALSSLRETGVSVPEALARIAETGVPTRAQLVESYPRAARAALATVRESNTGASVGDFLRAQLGIRSLEPKDGADPDAILSRAEAALAEGRIGDALAEIETLPEKARAVMSDWAAEAAARRDALAAAEALSAELN